MSDWKRQTLDAHNIFRKEHGVCALQWSDECYKAAKAQANACQARRCMFHGTTSGPSGDHGQNIYWCSAPGSSAQEMVKVWYDEIEQYDFGAATFHEGTGHFTQVVWKGTTHVGMACSDDGRFCVANYFPAGNVMGRFRQNVLPRGSPYVAEKEKPKPPARRMSWSGVSSGPGQAPGGPRRSGRAEAPHLNDLQAFFKDFQDLQVSKDTTSSKRHSGYGGYGGVVQSFSREARDTSGTSTRRSRSTGYGGTTTTVTRSVRHDGSVVTTTKTTTVRMVRG